LNNLYYLDLGNNDLTGSIPLDWVQGGMSSIRTLYVDYNSLSGGLPEALGLLGNGAIEQLVLNDNLFTGEFSVNSFAPGSLRVLELQHNGFDKMKRDICDLSVLENDTTGTMSIFKADCAVCVCDLFFCDTGRCFV
jgi:hypothetical protein